jgi:hypothetical protein
VTAGILCLPVSRNATLRSTVRSLLTKNVDTVCPQLLDKEHLAPIVYSVPPYSSLERENSLKKGREKGLHSEVIAFRRLLPYDSDRLQ